MLPKGNDGAAMCNLDLINYACLMKLCWAIRNGNNSLWIEVLKGKYTKRWSVNMNLEAKTYDSPLWKVIVKFCLAIENKQWWMVGNGNFMFGVISGLMKILD